MTRSINATAARNAKRRYKPVTMRLFGDLVTDREKVPLLEAEIERLKAEVEDLKAALDAEIRYGFSLPGKAPAIVEKRRPWTER